MKRELVSKLSSRLCVLHNKISQNRLASILSALEVRRRSRGSKQAWFHLPRLVSLLLLVNFQGEQTETVVSKCSAWNSAGATATQQVRRLLCISKTYSCELFPLHKPEGKIEGKWLGLDNKTECWCWRSSLTGHSVSGFLPLSVSVSFSLPILFSA